MMACFIDRFPSIHSGDLKLALFGHLVNLGDTRHCLETLLRRLIIGSKQYPNIEQIVGTVTDVISSSSAPTRLHQVSVRTSDGDEILDTALVIGYVSLFCDTVY
jgi:hypothetical protein